MMNELTNYAVAVGNYKSEEMIIQSNVVRTILANNLEINKSANKFIWAVGNLKFKITVSNPNSGSAEEIVITDVLNPELIRLVLDSITINGIPAGYGNFTYDAETGLLSIFLNVIRPNQSIVIEFAVMKHRGEVFRLENYASLTYGNKTAIRSNNESINDINKVISNIVIVNALSEVCRCREIYNHQYKNRNQ